MIKGWRNNPQWVKYFEQKRDAQISEQLKKLETKWQIQKIEKEIENESMRRAEIRAKGRRI